MGFLSRVLDKLKPYQPKGQLYKLLYASSNSIVKDVSVVKHEKSLIEGILFFISFCHIVLQANPSKIDVAFKPVINEVLDHIKHSGLLDFERDNNIGFVASRVELFTDEIYKTYMDNEDSTYVGGYVSFLLFEEPLKTIPERSEDLFKQMEINIKVQPCFKQISEYLIRTYDLSF